MRRRATFVIASRSPGSLREPTIRPSFVLACLCATLFLLSGCGVTPSPANGWAIVAVDVKTGDVGVAAASCNDYPFDDRASLVPGKGALVQLGLSSLVQRDRASAWIEELRPAPEIAQNITALSNDPNAEKRVYGIVTWKDNNVQVASFKGKETAPWAGGLLDADAAVAVQGSGLVNETVVRASFDAFHASEFAALTLADKLMRALEAGSAAGGSSLCSRNDLMQTASSAFLMLGRGGDPKFQVTTLGNTASQEPAPPYLALSVSEPIGGLNAVDLLREDYDVWRHDNLPPCDECDRAQIPVPEGRIGVLVRNVLLAGNSAWLVAGFVVVAIVVTVLYLVRFPRRRQ